MRSLSSGIGVIMPVSKAPPVYSLLEVQRRPTAGNTNGNGASFALLQDYDPGPEQDAVATVLVQWSRNATCHPLRTTALTRP
jgi:hypothetical protein